MAVSLGVSAFLCGCVDKKTSELTLEPSDLNTIPSSESILPSQPASESPTKEPEIPIQVQVTYTDEAGARRVRALTTHLKVSKKEDEIMATLDPTVGATFVTQKAGEESFSGTLTGMHSYRPPDVHQY